MRAWLLLTLEKLLSSFWLLPASMGIGAVLLAFASIAFDERVADQWLDIENWGYGGGVEGARSILQTIAGSMVSLSGLVFSMTLVVLSLASSQFGPRLLPNFMRSTTIQIVLGAFLATFVYCLIVLSSVRSGEITFVPHVSVSIGIILAVASLAVLIQFTHHVSVSIQADEMVERLGDDLSSAIHRLMKDDCPSERSTSSSSSDSIADGEQSGAAPVLANDDGYLQFVDTERLVELASGVDVVLRLSVRPGDYLVRGTPIVLAFSSAPLDEKFHKAVQSAFTVGRQRTATQDLESIVNQLVEIAARALSPGVNDPFTAIACIDRLASGFAELSRRQFPAAKRFDDAGHLRVIVSPESFGSVLDAAFSPLRQYAKATPQVTLRLLESLAQIGQVATDPDQRAELRKHAEMIAVAARESCRNDHDLQAVEARLSRVPA